jgi:hypothetical protein
MRLFVWVLALVPLLPSGFLTNPRQDAVGTRRDAQALNLVAQSLAANGGPAVTSIEDFTGTGTIAYNWAGEVVSGSVSVYGKGREEFRVDSSLPAGTQSLVLNGRDAILTPVYGPKAGSPIHATMTTGNLTLPAVRIAEVISDSSIGLRYVGSLTWNGKQVLHVHVVLSNDPRLRLGAQFSDLGEYELYLDANSYVVLGLAEKVWWDDDPRQSYLYELTFSDYRPVNGVLVPFAISERMGGQQTWSMTLSSMAFNEGLSDSLFMLPLSDDSPEGAN